MTDVPRSRGFIGSVRRWLGGRPAAAPGIPGPVAPAAERASAPDARIAVLLAEWQDVRATGRHMRTERLARLAAFLAVGAVIGGPYLRIAGRPGGRLQFACWALPVLGLLVALEFLALEIGAVATARVVHRRGRRVEAALQGLLPGSGRIPPIALETDGHEPGWQDGGWAAAALQGAVAVAWLAALVATAAGWLAAAAAP